MEFNMGDIVKHVSGAIGTVEYVFTSGKYVKIKVIQYKDKHTIGKLYNVLKTSLVKVGKTNYIKGGYVQSRRYYNRKQKKQ